MAISEAYTGSQTATVGTEHTLNTSTPETTDGIYQLFIDTSAMVAADITEIRIKEKARSADTQRQIMVATLAGAQSDPLWVSPTFVLMNGWDMTLKQTAGTSRAYPWSIRKVA
jgi:hypothetical protein